MPRSLPLWTPVALSVMAAMTLLPAAALGESSEIPFRPACQLADETAVSTALGVDVVGDDSLSTLLCTYVAGDATVAMVALTPEAPLEIVRLAFPDATELTIAGSPAVATAGEEGSTPPSVVVALGGDGVLMVNVMPDAGLADPLAAATALAEALLASGPVTAAIPEEATGPAIGFSGDPCLIVSPDEVGEIVDATITTAAPDGSGGCTYQTDMVNEMTMVGLSFSDGTLGSLRSGSTVDLAVAERTAVFWPDLSTVFVEIGGGRLFAVMVLAMTPTAEGGSQAIQDQAVAIAELAIGRMTAAG